MTEYKRIFLDTNPIIYYLQHNTEFGETVKAFLIAMRKERAQFVSLSEMEIVHTSEVIAKKAAQIRAEFTAFKAMDALQLATAVISGCDCFLTNDKQLQQFTEIKVQLIRNLEASSTE